MKRMMMVGLVVVVLAVACTTSPSSGGSTAPSSVTSGASAGGTGSGTTSGGPAPTCHSNSRWAVGDSITKGVYGISGWPNQTPAYGRFANLGAVGALARDLVPWVETEVGACNPGQRPIEIVFAAGINDLASGLSLDDMKAHVVDLVETIGIEVRLVSLEPLPATSPWVARNADRLAFNAWMAATFPMLYIDCSTPLEGADGWLLPSYDKDGAVHLTNAGEYALSACVMAAD